MLITNLLRFAHEFWPALALFGVCAVVGLVINDRRQRPISSFSRSMLDAAFQFHRAGLQHHLRTGTISNSELRAAIQNTREQIVHELTRVTRRK